MATFTLIDMCTASLNYIVHEKYIQKFQWFMLVFYVK